MRRIMLHAAQVQEGIVPADSPDDFVLSEGDEVPSQEAFDHVDAIAKHAQQVEAGLIPADSPPDFVRPEGDAALVNGLPWWMGPDYHPTPEAIAEFSKPLGPKQSDEQIELFGD